MGQALADQAGEGRVMTGTAANYHRHGARLTAGTTYDATGNLTNFITMHRDETLHQLAGKRRRFIKQTSHYLLSL